MAELGRTIALESKLLGPTLSLCKLEVAEFDCVEKSPKLLDKGLFVGELEVAKLDCVESSLLELLGVAFSVCRVENEEVAETLTPELLVPALTL
ncbi:hypothetical protein E4U48_005697 [Claviceps purpurea]|nr:hypothetical protein E4U48_005697 [Claviceps purpurea]